MGLVDGFPIKIPKTFAPSTMRTTRKIVVVDGIVRMRAGHRILRGHGEAHASTLPLDVIQVTHALASQFAGLVHS
jgi:hypothetical protein